MAGARWTRRGPAAAFRHRSAGNDAGADRRWWGGGIPAWDEAAGLSRSDLHWRNDCEAWLLSGGCELAGNGQFGRIMVGKGQLVAAQFDPERFAADRLTYFRFTRWRQTRALTQILADVGAAGSGGLALANGGMSLAVPWRVDYTHLIQPHADGSRIPTRA